MENLDSENKKTGMIPETKQEKPESYLKELLRFAVIAIPLVFFIRVFIVQPFIVSGESMDPTFKSGQYLIVDELTYHFEDPKRGDVVILKYPYSETEPAPYFIKRIIGLPGETIIVEGNSVTIKNKENPNGFVLKEPYIINKNFKDQELSATLGEEEYFVMGDNRPRSKDARIWKDGSWGPLPAKDIVGRPLVRLLPLDSASVFPGAYDEENY